MVAALQNSWEGIFPLSGIPDSSRIGYTKICEKLQFISVIDIHVS